MIAFFLVNNVEYLWGFTTQKYRFNDASAKVTVDIWAHEAPRKLVKWQ